jgi:hypothetical protein
MKHTFSPAAELDFQLLVHEAVQVDDVFLLWSLFLLGVTSGAAASSTTSTSTVTTSASVATSSKVAAFRHCSGRK